MNQKYTAKQTEVLQALWGCSFARAMSLHHYSQHTVNSLNSRGLISWVDDGRSRHVMWGLTHQGFAVCERLFGPRNQSKAVL
jgi:hypothetical protein